MLQPILNQLKPKMAEVVIKLEEDLRTIRTGKASASLIENILISYYGVQTPLKNMANITAPDAFLLVIQPWDANALNDIENGIKAADLSMSTTNDGRVIRISLPPLTEERRNDFIKLIHQKEESARIALRNVRQTSWEEVQAGKKTGELTEDDLYSGEKDLNKLIEEANNKIKTIIDAKEKELKTI